MGLCTGQTLYPWPRSRRTDLLGGTFAGTSRLLEQIIDSGFYLPNKEAWQPSLLLSQVLWFKADTPATVTEACLLNLSFGVGGFGSMIPAAHFLSPWEMIIKLKMRPSLWKHTGSLQGKMGGGCSQLQFCPAPHCPAMPRSLQPGEQSARQRNSARRGE